MAFTLRGLKRIEYASLIRGLEKEPVANPVLQLFQLTRDSVVNELKITAGSHFLCVIGSGNAPEMKEAFEAEEHNKDVSDKLRRKRVPSNGVDA